MNKIKILHCADVHIGAAESFLGLLSANRRYETLLTFERIIDLALENQVQVLAISGDLFDSNNIEKELITPVFDKIASVHQIKVIFSAGNHDPLTSDSPFKAFKLPENLYVMDIRDSVITFEDLGLRVYGKSFEQVYLKGEADFGIIPPNDDYINLMVIHGETRSDLASDYNAITPAFIKNSKMDYIALGHTHKKSEIGKMDNTYFAYSGCPEGQGFDETDQKGIYLGEIGKRYCDLKFIPTASRQHILSKTDISGLLDTAEICSRIIADLKEKCGDNYRENLYKIELVGSVAEEANLNLTEITSRISAEVYFAKVKNKTEISIDKEKLAAEVSLKGIFVKNMLEKLKNADDSDKDIINKALNLGLRAFNSEVSYED